LSLTPVRKAPIWNADKAEKVKEMKKVKKVRENHKQHATFQPSFANCEMMGDDANFAPKDAPLSRK
jgi:hypothetical protein